MTVGRVVSLARAGDSSFDYECRRYKFARTVKDRGVCILYCGPSRVDNGLVSCVRRYLCTLLLCMLDTQAEGNLRHQSLLLVIRSLLCVIVVY